MKLRKAVLGDRLRQEHPPKDAAVQTDACAAPAAASPVRYPATPRRRASLPQQPDTGPFVVRIPKNYPLLLCPGGSDGNMAVLVFKLSCRC